MDLAREAPNDVVGILYVGRGPIIRHSLTRAVTPDAEQEHLTTRHSVKGEAPAT